jgi:iron complex transport system ATP-binding protein
MIDPPDPPTPAVPVSGAGPVSDAGPALHLTGVTVWEWDARLRQRQPILSGIDWTVGPGEQWAVLGPNGAGKSTLLDVAAGMRHPSRGRVEILGETVGRVDLRALRERIGHVDVKTEEAFSPRRTALDVVLTGATGTIQVLEDRLDDAVRERAALLLGQFGCAGVAAHSFASCSQGERRRILLARALLRRPPLLLLDEPADGLDLPGREALLAALATLAAEQPAPAVVLVTHHLEELPPSITHALLLAGGRAVACGAAPAVLADEPLSACFGVPVTVTRAGGRWAARATPSW